ncbi:D-beta-D-heptose 1-phosphate adenosyltransferase [Cellulomonas sp. WB94]|uniref:DeoR/GlpR family DNA-binding transcription regulator n=1 Tax=Cellulomonas sp. WB94 TaxID=2173174 RepID=UPI000D56CF19|nr:DeoR/GlpR family DNA-binding transcription regulator [Cellulomonas sp. WB94]PVU83941.1 D-beta-D-heptose 1-phosphate adenosyltransferase [Cellulomonas sp. WB94]
MYATERHQEILRRARAEGRVEVKQIAEDLDVTPETVRRDLTALERLGVLRRVHGGAIPVERLGIEPAVDERETRLAGQKERIAKVALDELPDGGSIIIDAGTTTVRIAQMLPLDRELMVVTHSLPVANLLISKPNVTLYLLGGVVRPRTLAAVGDWTRSNLADVFVDVAFIGTNGITATRGLTTPDLGEAAVKRALISAARRTVVLADHTKFGREDFAHVCDLEAIDTVISDTGLADEMADEIEDAGPTVVRA